MAEHIALLERTIEAASDESRSRVGDAKRQLDGDLRALHLRAVHAENLAAENFSSLRDAVITVPRSMPGSEPAGESETQEEASPELCA